MADYINNVLAADIYTPALTLGPDARAKSATITVAANPALMQFAVGDEGTLRWLDDREFDAPAGPNIINSFRVSNIRGIRFRNAVVGAQAQILCTLSSDQDDDPVFESGLLSAGSISSGGTVTNPVAASAAAKIRRNPAGLGPQSIATSLITTINFDVSDYDTNAIVDLAHQPTRLTCKTAGVYKISGGVEFAQQAAGTERVARIVLNGVTVLGNNNKPPVSSDITQVQVEAFAQLQVNDYVELQVFQDSGGAVNVDAIAQYTPFLAMAKQP